MTVMTGLQALFLLGSKDPVIIDAALELLITLLDKSTDESVLFPNVKVLSNIMEVFSSRPDETFFQNVSSLIEKSKGDIRQRKTQLIKKDKRSTKQLTLPNIVLEPAKKKKKSKFVSANYQKSSSDTLVTDV